MSDVKLKTKNTFEKFLNSELLEDGNQNKIPEGYKVVKSYPLNPPFSYATILQDTETSGYLYYVDEVQLNQEEEIIFQKLYDLIEHSLDLERRSEKNSGINSYLNKVLEENKKIFQSYTLASLEKVKYYLKKEIVGFGLIDPIMHDPNIEDISCSGIKTPIYVWHREFDSVPTNVEFEDEKLNNFITRIVFRAGKHISSAYPISDLALEGNHRISVLYQKEITPKGTSFTIRKFREDPYTVIDLIKFGTIDIEIAAYMWMLIEAKMSIIVIGSTGSGKTTILNAISGLVHPDYKIFSVEDVAEVNINHENWFSLVSRSGFGVNQEGEIGMYDLIKSGVRHRPDYIVVGEIRGSEAYVMFQAMATGHGGLCTMHADSLNSATKRLQQKPMDIPPAYISLMNCAIVIRRITDLSTGQSSRKAITVEEIKDFESYHSAFHWNPKTDFFESDLQNSTLLKKIGQQAGNEMEEVLKEYNRRIKILKWMLEHDIRDFKKVSDVVGKYYRDPKALMQKIDYEV